MSTVKRDELVGAIGAGIQRWQDATEAFDETVGRIHGLNSAERRCLSFVSQGPQAASAIAKETKLTPAAITALIDRLESRGLVRRRADTADRRRVLVEATEITRDLVRSAYGPIARAGAELLGGYSLAELATIRRFVDDALALQSRMTEALLERTRKRGRARD
jgi:DNA-binding MarR family transcriptional regulator